LIMKDVKYEPHAQTKIQLRAETGGKSSLRMGHFDKYNEKRLTEV
jgi:hypothetical protein